ncbi:hypothetical protein B296_00035323 [Ensete ventricosum]|uniref:Uncharacterized protein n=1 Tax=Ensete ventricosum TaxID=4639 RepID=A0A426Y4H3_ENSVE|nr:hypothetical protein B296_00035323 [Ensete ventricosum]
MIGQRRGLPNVAPLILKSVEERTNKQTTGCQKVDYLLMEGGSSEFLFARSEPSEALMDSQDLVQMEAHDYYSMLASWASGGSTVDVDLFEGDLQPLARILAFSKSSGNEVGLRPHKRCRGVNVEPPRATTHSGVATRNDRTGIAPGLGSPVVVEAS